MPKIIKNGEVVEDNLTILGKDFDGKLTSGPAIVHKLYWLSRAETLISRPDIGVWLDSEDGPEELQPYLKNIAVIAINFPAFGDGRGYSHARILRERMGYTGEIRAIGEVLRDQMFYMKRCGFNAFAVREDKDINDALSALNDISESYQAATDQNLPLFRRRD
jgi:uncharacterized protein (DUF934 family)